MKVSVSDIVALLQLFEQGDELLHPRRIEQLKVSHPTAHTTLATFRYQKQLYFSIIDSTAEDNTHALLEYILAEKTDAAGEFIANPKSEALTTYAMPYKGKEAYLFKLRALKKRLDIFLSERSPETSRSTWQKYIKAGYVAVNDEVVNSPKQEVSNTDLIVTNIPESTDYSQRTLPIIYLDDNVIVVNKPVGVLTHSKGALNDEFNVADFFRRYTTYNLATNRPGIIHRLDRDTSGVIVGARNPETATLLQKQFADRKVKKTYIAVLDGLLKEKEAQIELPIGRNPAAPSTFRVDSKGKLATTYYRVTAEHEGKSLVKLKPLTGRTHQLRVHMQYLHAPIHGDKVYGKAADRLYLHALQLEITIPKGDRQVFSASLPPEFTAFFKEPRG